MHDKNLVRVLIAIAVLGLATLACGLYLNMGTTPSPAPLPPIPTLMPPTLAPPTLAPPTAAPQPTVEDTAAPPPEPESESTATEETSQQPAEVTEFYQRGFLPYENGEFYQLDDFSGSAKSLNVMSLTHTGQQVQDFALWADIELKSIGLTTYPKYTGCGFAYRALGMNEGYTAVLTNDYVRMGACASDFKLCDLFGTAYGFGTGQVDVPNGTKAEFSMAVNKNHAWVMVNGMQVGQYVLYETKLAGTGDLDYAVVSNINGGYSTTCNMTNIRLWKSQP